MFSNAPFALLYLADRSELSCGVSARHRDARWWEGPDLTQQDEQARGGDSGGSGSSESDYSEEAQRRRWAQLTGEGDGGLDSERRQEEGRHDVGDEVQRGGIAWMMALLPDDCHVRTLSPSPYVFDDSSQAGFGCRN